MQSFFCRNIWQSITESRICCVTYLLTLFELPSLKDLLSSSDYANPSVWHPGWIFCPPLSLFNNSNEKNYKTGNWIAALTRRFSFGEKGWWTQHSSVWPEKYRKPRTEILKLNTKHLKQKSENINRNRTFQMRTAQLVGWTLDTGQSPDWLFTRAVRRGRESSENFQRFWDNFQKYSTFS